MIEGNVLLTVEDLQTAQGVSELNRMIQELYDTVDEQAKRYAFLTGTND